MASHLWIAASMRQSEAEIGTIAARPSHQSRRAWRACLLAREGGSRARPSGRPTCTTGSPWRTERPAAGSELTAQIRARHSRLPAAVSTLVLILGGRQWCGQRLLTAGE